MNFSEKWSVLYQKYLCVMCKAHQSTKSVCKIKVRFGIDHWNYPHNLIPQYFFEVEPVFWQTEKWTRKHKTRPSISNLYKDNESICVEVPPRSRAHNTLIYHKATVCSPQIQSQEKEYLRTPKRVVSIGLFCFYFVSFSYNGVYFHRLIFNCTTINFNQAHSF